MSAIDEIIAERLRQITGEGYTLEGDLENHRTGDLAAGACAAITGKLNHWVFNQKHGYRQRLVVAGALIVAEIERLDIRDGADG